MADPKKGTGKKPKGSGRRLYTDENPKDTVKIKFATPADARATVAKVKRIKKPFARKIQILTVGEQRAKVMGKSQVVNIFNKIRSYKNVNYLSSINYYDIGKYLNYADVCIIPFQKNELSQYILPNKLFEYSLMKKPIIMTDFNKDLKNLKSSKIRRAKTFCKKL